MRLGRNNCSVPCLAERQVAKAAPFATENAGTLRKSAAGEFCLSTSRRVQTDAPRL